MKRKTLFSGIICLLIFSVGCVEIPFGGKSTSTTRVLPTTSSSTSTTSSSTTSSSTTTTSTSTTSTSTSTTLESLTDILCERKWDPVAKDKCYRDLAVEKMDSRICALLEYTNYRNSCFYRIALAAQEPLLCDYIWDESLRDRCYTFVKREEI